LDSLNDQPRDREASTRLHLERALKRARGSLLWERLWPALATLATALGLFLALSWAGLWTVLPPVGRAVGLVFFLLLTAVAAIPLFRVRLPRDAEALHRIDRVSGEKHRPATAVTDEIAANSHDPVSQALWQAHVERALMSARKLRAGWPSPRLSLRDPIALRALTLILVATTFIAAGGERWKRVAAAFDWHGVVAPANFRVDAWVNPPTYTGRPPMMLTGQQPADGSAAMASAPVSVPAGSQLIVRATGNVHLEVTRKGGLDEVADTDKTALPAGTEEHRLVIKSDGTASVHGVLGSEQAWTFKVIPDRAPTIALTRDPERQARGALKLDYKVDDDYGVVEGKAIFALKDTDAAGKHPLYGPPEFPLTLPQLRTRSGAAQTTRDLSDNPWAGAEVTVSLTAKDEAGNVGKSEPRELTLPQRIFVKPLARALIEQRRDLALDAGAKPIVLTALDALTLAPEKFTPEAGVYLGLRSIYYDLQGAKTDDQLREVVTRLWDMALQIEDGNVSQAEQALRQAQENLRQALERGASDEEIQKLMQDLRAAMDKFMQALAEEMRKNPQQLARPLDRNTRTLTQRDLNSMLDRLENLARSGNREAAQQLLNQLQSMLENLQMARPGASPDQGDDEMSQSLDELGDMIRKQQQLRDRTYKQGQDSRRDRQLGGPKPKMGDLQQDQQALKDRMSKLLEQLRKRGLGQQQQGQQGQKGQKGQQGQQGQQQGDEMGELGDAGEAMGEAEGQLGEGDADNAVDSQGRALEAMRKGAQGLAQQMQQQGQGQVGQGPNGQPGPNGRQRANSNTDPLGRPLRGRGYDNDPSVKVPGEIDAQRARRILEELRKRYGESSRPQLELDYIERLLKGF
jgi:uncharacterized protein (TIGR02302 family)